MRDELGLSTDKGWGWMRKFFSAFGRELISKAGEGETGTVSVLKSGGFKEGA